MTASCVHLELLQMSEYRCSRQIEEGIGGSRPQLGELVHTLMCVLKADVFKV